MYAWDAEKDFPRYGNGPTEPCIPQFIAMWCGYVTAIAPQYGWTQIEIGNVVNQNVAVHLETSGSWRVTSCATTPAP